MNIELAKTKVVRQLDNDQLHLVCKQILTWLYGCYRLVPELFEFEVNELTTILKGFPDLKFNDVKIAFTNGMATEYNRPCVANYTKWLSTYSEKEKPANNYSEYEMVRLKLASKTEPTESEKEQIANNALNFSFETYKKTGQIIDMGNAIYDRLERDRKIFLTLDEKMEIYKKATQKETNRLHSELNSASNNMDKIRHNDIMNQLISMNNFATEPIKAEAKRIALAQYFDKLISEQNESNNKEL